MVKLKVFLSADNVKVFWITLKYVKFNPLVPFDSNKAVLTRGGDISLLFKV